MAIRDTLTLTIKRAKDIDISNLSVIVAFYILLSLIPLIITIGAILPFFNINPEAVLTQLSRVTPAPILELLQPTVSSMLTTTHNGLLSISIIGTIWSAAKGMNFIQKGIDRAYCLQKARHFITSRIIAVGILILVILMLAAAMIFFSYGEILLKQIMGFNTEIMIMKWPITFLLLFITMIIIYRLTPSIQVKLKDGWLGALFVALCLMLMVELFAVYLRSFTGSLSAYGLISGLFMLMLWIRLLSYVILFGAVINATLYEKLHGLPQRKESRLDSWLTKGIDKLLTRP